ncbi:hypothetical protein ACLM5H_16310 [Fredinandcohnia humi]
MSNFEKEYLSIVVGQFKHFKERAEKGIHQLSEVNYTGNRRKSQIALQ